MPTEPRKHTRVTLVNGVAVVGFVSPESIFGTKDVQELDDELRRLVAEDGHTRLLLNLNGIRYFSSSMLVHLIQLQKRVEPAGPGLPLQPHPRHAQDVPGQQARSPVRDLQ